jgi:hypothetical protein
MGSLYPCKHCNGTTFCSASRDATGKLKTRAACVCCLIKAGLNPNGVYDKVVCSVCRGKGMVEPAGEPVKVKRGPDRWLLAVVLALLLVALTFFVFSALSYYRPRPDYGDIVDQLLEERGGAAAAMQLSDARAAVRAGMTEEAVKLTLGEPYAIRPGEGGQELWIYRCKDGKLLITFSNGVVYGRQ